MSEEKKTVNVEELDQFAGGEIPWGPFHDVAVSCPHCKKRLVVYGFPAICIFCNATIFERDYNG